ncbi:unnamed protein product [Vitrella brassicaformis CCMP3155]|uniref:Uncharacterized protein n=1 Tax=Vitrella brassicaformis (strain CCMP3155) TaxID=1169540 RepID=A0A0G4FR14_VITBC|nr:unnamed protein product [Vitrella brassicaformis CCMP3155]|eukprot:CEM16894.1 unnamed protein product [Vitrella brassicaformis CCMP3155]
MKELDIHPPDLSELGWDDFQALETTLYPDGSVKDKDMFRYYVRGFKQQQHVRLLARKGKVEECRTYIADLVSGEAETAPSSSAGSPESGSSPQSHVGDPTKRQSDDEFRKRRGNEQDGDTGEPTRQQ